MLPDPPLHHLSIIFSLCAYHSCNSIFLSQWYDSLHYELQFQIHYPYVHCKFLNSSTSAIFRAIFQLIIIAQLKVARRNDVVQWWHRHEEEGRSGGLRWTTDSDPGQTFQTCECLDNHFKLITPSTLPPLALYTYILIYCRGSGLFSFILLLQSAATHFFIALIKQVTVAETGINLLLIKSDVIMICRLVW